MYGGPGGMDWGPESKDWGPEIKDWSTCTLCIILNTGYNQLFI